MSVFTRDALEGSSLADLHTIAGELGLDGFRRLRKAELVDKILATFGEADGAPAEEAEEKPKPRRSRAGRSRAAKDADPGDADEPVDAKAESSDDEEAEPKPARRSRGGRGRGKDTAETDAPAPAETAIKADLDDEVQAEGRGGRRRAGREVSEDQIASGVVEVLGNGSGFLRVSPPDPSDEDIYISAAQVRRCELVSGDRISGPVRPPRRSERYPSLVRIDEINDRPADEVAEGTPFDELPATFPTAKLDLGKGDGTVAAIAAAAPIGRGSRVVIAGPARSGKTEALQALAAALVGQEDLELTLVLAGVRPEETAVAPEGVVPVGGVSFAASADAQGQAVDRAIDAARRIAARGGHAVVLVDTLDGLHPSAARKTLAAARAIKDGGTLTVIATASAPLGGETTVVALSAPNGTYPAVDAAASGTIKADLLA